MLSHQQDGVYDIDFASFVTIVYLMKIATFTETYFSNFSYLQSRFLIVAPLRQSRISIA